MRHCLSCPVLPRNIAPGDRQTPWMECVPAFVPYSPIPPLLLCIPVLPGHSGGGGVCNRRKKAFFLLFPLLLPVAPAALQIEINVPLFPATVSPPPQMLFVAPSSATVATANRSRVHRICTERLFLLLPLFSFPTPKTWLIFLS